MGSSTSISRMLVGGGRRQIGYPWGINQSKPSFIPGTFVLMGLPPCRLLPPSHRPTSCFPNAPIDSNPQVRPVHDSFRSFFFFSLILPSTMRARWTSSTKRVNLTAIWPWRTGQIQAPCPTMGPGSVVSGPALVHHSNTFLTFVYSSHSGTQTLPVPCLY